MISFSFINRVRSRPELHAGLSVLPNTTRSVVARVLTNILQIAKAVSCGRKQKGKGLSIVIELLKFYCCTDTFFVVYSSYVLKKSSVQLLFMLEQTSVYQLSPTKV